MTNVQEISVLNDRLEVLRIPVVTFSDRLGTPDLRKLMVFVGKQRPYSRSKRICQVISLKRAHLEEYKRIHTEVWDSVLDGLRRSHIVDYSIHFLPSPPFAMVKNPTEEIAGLLIATFKYVGQDFDGDMKRAAEDEETQRWWKVTDGMQQSLVDGAKSSKDGEWWYPCEEVFRFEK